MSDYFFTCDVCGREIQGCTWVNGMKFCAKCYQETFGNTNPFEKELRDKIADLEAKLAESKNKLNQYPYKNEVVEEQYEDLKDAINFLMLNNIKDQEQLNYSIDVLCAKHKARIRDIENGISVIEQLKQQLAEKEKEIEELEQRVSDKSTALYGAEMIARSTQFFLEKEIHDLKLAKIDFAIEQLEKAKEYLKDRIKIIEGDECIYDIDEIVGASCENKKTLEKIDQQIKELKGK